MEFLRKIERTFPMEMGVYLLIVLFFIQNMVLYYIKDFHTFIFTNLIALLGVAFGFFGTSLVVAAASLIMVGIGCFILFFQPIIMPGYVKALLILGIPFYAVLSYQIKRSIFNRRRLVDNLQDVRRYLENTDSLTGLRSMESFRRKYQQFQESLSTYQSDNRALMVSLFYLDFYEQYYYQDAVATDKIVKMLAETLYYTSYPEELYFYVGQGTFVVLSAITDVPEEVERIQKINQITKTQMELIPFPNGELQDITIRMGEIKVEKDSVMTAEQVLSRLHRRAEADLAEEYIV